MRRMQSFGCASETTFPPNTDYGLPFCPVDDWKLALVFELAGNLATKNTLRSQHTVMIHSRDIKQAPVAILLLHFRAMGWISRLS